MASRLIIREALSQLSESLQRGVTPRTGICWQVINVAGDIAEQRGEAFNEDVVQDWLDTAARRWPKHSGDGCYPVPDPYEARYTFAARNRYESSNAEQRWSGPYGDLRRELLAFLIKEIA